MGKHERDWVEQAEKDVASALNGQPVNTFITSIANEIKKHIDVSNPGFQIVQAEWSGGNNYDDPGDVLVHITCTLQGNKVVNVELKFSRKKGSGTLKNPGQAFFKKSVNENIQSYSEFEKEFKEQRVKYLEKHLGISFKNYSAYCRALRKIRDSADAGNVSEQLVVEKIVAITNPGKEQYAQYAAIQLNQYLDKVNEIVPELLGLDKDDPAIKQGTVYCIVKNFESSKQTVEFYDYSEMDRELTEVVARAQGIVFLNKHRSVVLRFQVNFKNICQGGAAPSFNVWPGNAFN
jgi:hypothetical protein